MKTTSGSKRATTLIVSHNTRNGQREANPALTAAKREFLAALKAVGRGMAGLKDAVAELVAMDVEPGRMVEWGVAAGFQAGWVRSVVSLAMIRAGRRRRRAGAGPRPPAAAKKEARRALGLWGVEAPKVLLAAYRLARKELRAHPAKYQGSRQEMALAA